MAITGAKARPPVVERGAKLGVVALGSRVDSAALHSGCAALRAAGWPAECPPEALASDGGFAGSVAARTESLRRLWRGEDVAAILCARGGYGANYLLPQINFAELRKHPKPFLGYSDNTALLLALDRAGLVAFHGPMVASDFANGAADVESFAAALAGWAQQFDFNEESKDDAAQIISLRDGEAEGTIIGGCLSLVVASLGTPWEIESAGRILFLEDVNEKNFRIDRMLRQLVLAGKFRDVRGVVFGAMSGCGASGGDEDGEPESLPQMILRVLGGLRIPVAFGLPSGHVPSGNLTLPFGVPAALRCAGLSVSLRIEGVDG